MLCVRNRKITLDGWLLTSAMAIAIVVRIYFASRPEVGLDDAISGDIAALPFVAMLKVISKDPNMALYYVLLHFWSALAGNSPLALRMLSILFSVAAVPAIYFLGSRLFNESVGLRAAFLLAANATAVEYAQIIRSYSLLILLVIASSFFFSKLIAPQKTNATDSWPYITASALAVYSHMHAALMLVAQASSAWFRKTVPWRDLITSGIIVGLAVLPLPLVAVANYHGQYSWMPPVHLKSIVKIVPFLFGAPFFQKAASAIALTLSSVALGYIGAVNQDFSSWSRAFTLNGLLVPLGLCGLLSLVRPFFFGEPRYLLICLPFSILLVALGINSVRRPVFILCIVILLELWQVAVRPLRYEIKQNRTYWSDATDYLVSNAKPGDGVVMSWTTHVWLYWYYEAQQDKYHSRLRLAFPDLDAQTFAVNGVFINDISLQQHPSAKWFESEGPKYERLWIILDPYYDNTTEPLLSTLASRHIEVQQKFPDGLKVVLSVAGSSR